MFEWVVDLAQTQGLGSGNYTSPRADAGKGRSSSKRGSCPQIRFHCIGRVDIGYFDLMILNKGSWDWKNSNKTPQAVMRLCRGSWDWTLRRDLKCMKSLDKQWLDQATLHRDLQNLNPSKSSWDLTEGCWGECAVGVAAAVVVWLVLKGVKDLQI